MCIECHFPARDSPHDPVTASDQILLLLSHSYYEARLVDPGPAHYIRIIWLKGAVFMGRIIDHCVCHVVLRAMFHFS